MTKLIIIPGETLDRAYERAIERIRVKYHSLPTYLSTTVENVPYHENVEYDGDKPIGKVIG